jgi:hypothetical protein
MHVSALVMVGLLLAACGSGDDGNRDVSAPEVTDEGEPIDDETSEAEPSVAPAPEPEVNLVAEIDRLLADDPDLCGTEMTGALALLEDELDGEEFARSRAESIIEGVCADYEWPEEEAAGDEYAQFGDTWTWEDGLQGVIEAPTTFEPRDGREIDGVEDHLLFTITLTNETGEGFDPSLTRATVQSGGREAESVYDSSQSVGNTPSGTLIDGRSVSWDEGWGVLDPDDIVLEFTPSWDHSSVIYVLE